MKLGLANHKVDVVKHDPAWRQEFARCRSELALVTEIAPTRIEHIAVLPFGICLPNLFSIWC